MAGQVLKWAVVLFAVVRVPEGSEVRAGEPIDVGSRLELFVDRYLIDSLEGGAARCLQKPQPREVVLLTDAPWEGNTCAYYTIFQDGDRYRMYYRGSHFDQQRRKAAHREVTCYAESRDGIRWTKPTLGLFEFDGSKQNNIVWDGVGTHNFTPFKDANPNCPDEARYKALGRGSRGYKHGLYAFQSADGIHWRLISGEPVITRGAFDSQNLAFWDPLRKCYVDFHRTFDQNVRAIMTCTSDDFLHWTEPVLLEYPGAAKEHLYTNAIRPYPRAPHIYIGFPARFLPATQQVEPEFMSSREGRTFRRWTEPVIPFTAPEDRDGNRSNYMAWGLVQLPGQDREYSVYATEAYYTGTGSRLRRFTYRVDGFVSVHAPEGGGQLVTKPISFAGRCLAVNFQTRGNGVLRVQIEDGQGRPIEGFALADCLPLRGDAIDAQVRWTNGHDVAALAGRAVRLRFRLANADLYSFQFRP